MLGERASVRLLIDFELRAPFRQTAASLAVFDEFADTFGPFTQAWLFHSDAAPLSRGFFFPPGSTERYGIPRGLGPHCVLIDTHGDQLWLDGIACGGANERVRAAVTVLRRSGFVGQGPLSSEFSSAVSDCDELHLVGDRILHRRPLSEPPPISPPGKTFVAAGRLVNRLEFDKGGVTAVDLWDCWQRATEPYGWLGRPIELIRYDNRRRSEQSGHAGCQLIAIGDSGRELWLQLPEPDTYDRLSNGQRNRYEGAYSEYELIERDIFRSVGATVESNEDRPWWWRVTGRHAPAPEIIRWP
jgi:hypothetical protein